MNNHWRTNCRAYQNGLVEFRYALRPHDRDGPAAASACATLRAKLGRRGWIVRFFGTSDERRTVNLSWTGHAHVKVWRSDLREQKLE